MKKIFYTILLLLPISFMAQTTVKGKVIDGDKFPLPGASVIVKGTTNGQTTDFDGLFSIKLDKTPVTLVVSYLGYTSKEVLITNQKDITVELKADTEQLEEIVVIGYGSVNKKDLTGSVTTIKVDETAAQQTTTIDQLLQGRAAGVQVTQNAGSPGSGVSVRIRGASSLRGNNEPLYVVDGVIIASAGEDAADAGGGNSLQESQNGLNGINPRDIESMQVLKDASATAIYGSRGANGVIIITTKKGKKGKVSVSSYLTSTVSTIDKEIDVLSGLQFANYINEVEENAGNNPIYQINSGEIFPISYTTNPSGGADIPTVGTDAIIQHNWQDEIYNVGFSKSAGASFSGGSDKGSYYVSMGYNDQGGIVQNSRFQSGNFSMNLTQDISENLKLDARFSAFYADGSFAQDGDRAGGGNRSFTSNIITYKPLVGTELDEDFDDDDNVAGPYTWIDDFEDISEEARFRGSLALTYKFGIKGLSYKFQAGGNIRDKERRRFYGLTTGIGKFTNGLLNMSKLNQKTYQVNNLLNYNHTFNRKHRVSAVLGVTYDVRNSKNTLYQTSQFSTVVFGSDLPNYGQSVIRPLTVNPSKTQLLSYLTRVNYTYNNKYIFTGSYRIDGSSKFSEENRYSAFPSFSLAWKAGNEDFLKDLESLSNLKVRAGWGKTGNQAINPYQTFANYSGVISGSTGNGTTIGFVPTNIANPDLIWETTTQINLGLDFGFLQDRISGNVDVYTKQTDDLLQLERLPTSTGFENLLINRGSIKTEGLELSLNAAVVNKKDFTIDIGGNIAFNRNEILNLGVPESEIYINEVLEQRSFYLGDRVSSGNRFGAAANVFIEGEQIGLFYGFKTDGIYQTGDQIDVAGAVPGDVRIIDIDGDNVITSNDRTTIGNPNPDFIYGGYLNMKYKRLSLDVLMNGTYGNQILNGTNYRIGYADGSRNNFRAEAFTEAWRPNAQSNTQPRIGYDPQGTSSLGALDRQVEDGSFLRISNITLGYDIPVEKSSVFSRANVYISGSNLFTFTNYSGYNPEITNFLNNGNILGTEWNGAPNASSITLGLNLNF